MKRFLYLLLVVSLLLGPLATSGLASTGSAAGSEMATALVASTGSATVLPETAAAARLGFLPAHDSPTGVLPVGLTAPDLVQLAGDWSNSAAWACITPLGIIYNTSFGAGLTAPPPWDLVAGLTEYTANLALKFCAPVLYAPPDMTPAHSVDEDGRCRWTFDQPRTQGKFKNWLGITLPWGDVFPGKSWGDLGEPTVFHWNTQVDVSVDLEQAAPLGGDRYELLVGNHSLTWRADTLLSPLDFVFTYVPGWAWGKLAKKYKLTDLTRQMASQTTDAVINLIGGELDFIPSFPTMTNEEIQRVAVTDRTKPTLTGNQAVALQAIEPGGLSRGTYLSMLRRGLTVRDNCDALPELIAQGEDRLPEFVTLGGRASVTWMAEDNGPRDLSGSANQSDPLVQSFSVVDTLAPIMTPPPDLVTETVDLPALLHLGQPATFDLADLNPTVSHNACIQPGVQCSGNDIRFPAGKTAVTWTAVDDAGNKVTTEQTINVKSPGSNHAPTAEGTSASATSYEPVTITLKAGDPDGDRLWFEIEEQPGGGFFHSPLYPYFIQDYRLANVAEVDFEAYCTDPNHFGDYIEVDWPVEARRMTVDDEGRVYVQDYGRIKCYDASPGVYYQEYRLAVFRPDGSYEERTSGINQRDMHVDQRHDLLYISQFGVGGANPTLLTFDLDLNPIGRYRTDYTSPSIQEPYHVMIDVERSLLYASDGTEFRNGELILMDLPAPNPNPSAYEDAVGIATYTPPGLATSSFQGLALDSQGNLYASERHNDRIYKWSAATRHEDGSVTPGDFIGWMGLCDSGPGCDEANGRSFGYSCTPTTCSASESSGSRSGQFDYPRGIAMDPNDILYVTDYNNQRVQRFTPEGFFAGQAISDCGGNCFTLGDFAPPQEVTVNSSHFYVLDDEADLLHVFETTPITRLTEDSAEIVYQSDNNFVGADSFSYLVSDGLDESAPVTVTIDVSRNYRPPAAIGPLEATTLEDNWAYLPVDGYDPDEPLDTLTFVDVAPPAHGSFVRQGDDYYYQPDPNFEGTDRFSYAAYDGVAYSPAEEVTVSVAPVNDPPELSEDEGAGGQSARQGLPRGFVLRNAPGYAGLGRLAPLGTADEPLRVGAGFRTTFNVIWEDPDLDDRHMVVVHWGDGSGSEQEGELLDDGTMTGPVLSEGRGGGMGTVTAEHVFANAGTFTSEVCVSDQVDVDTEGNKSLTATSITRCLPLEVLVTPMVDLLVDIRPSASPYPAGSALHYELVVTNNAPESGGLTATGLRLIDALDTRLRAGAVAVNGGGRCAAKVSEVECTLDSLAPGESVTVTIPALPARQLEPGMVLGNHVRFEVDQANQAEVQQNGNLVTVVAPADFVVNTYGDGEDANLGDGQCATADGACSLRAAISEANNMAPGLRTISLADWQIMISEELAVRYDVAITGLGAGRTVIAGFGQNRLFSVVPNASLILNGLSLQQGNTEESGSALYNWGTTTLDGVQVSGNYAGGTGALVNEGALTLLNSAVTGNEAGDGVGGIMNGNGATLRLENVTISGNQGKYGALINTSAMSLENVTISGNHSTVVSGGLFSVSSEEVTVRNTILAGNSSDGDQSFVDCQGSVTSLGHNLLGAGCEQAATASDITGGLPHLQPLERGANNTMFHPLRGDGPAVDAGSCATAFDQTGTSRPLDGNVDGVARCDIGATEFVPLRLLLPVISR